VTTKVSALFVREREPARAGDKPRLSQPNLGSHMHDNDDVYSFWSLSPEPNRQAIRFYGAVAQEVCGDARFRDDVQVVLVTHAYENVLPFLQSLDKVFSVAGVIFKNSTNSLRPEYAKYIAEKALKFLSSRNRIFPGQALETGLMKE
jgi:hypothetical protein